MQVLLDSGTTCRLVFYQEETADTLRPDKSGRWCWTLNSLGARSSGDSLGRSASSSRHCIPHVLPFHHSSFQRLDA